MRVERRSNASHASLTMLYSPNRHGSRMTALRNLTTRTEGRLMGRERS